VAAAAVLTLEVMVVLVELVVEVVEVLNHLMPLVLVVLVDWVMVKMEFLGLVVTKVDLEQLIPVAAVEVVAPLEMAIQQQEVVLVVPVLSSLHTLPK
jgi:hypothetical protein